MEQLNGTNESIFIARQTGRKHHGSPFPWSQDNVRGKLNYATRCEMGDLRVQRRQTTNACLIIHISSPSISASSLLFSILVDQFSFLDFFLLIFRERKEEKLSEEYLEIIFGGRSNLIRKDMEKLLMINIFFPLLGQVTRVLRYSWGIIKDPGAPWQR